MSNLTTQLTASTRKHIQVTFKEAQIQAHELDDCANDLLTIQRELDSIINELRSGWEGEAAELFYSKCRALEAKVSTTAKDVRQISVVVNKVANNYYKTEMEAVARMEAKAKQFSGGGNGGGGGSAW